MNARNRRLEDTRAPRRRARFILAVVVGCGVFALTHASPSHAQFVQQGSKLVGTGAIGHAKQGSGVALSADGSTAIVGAANDGGKGAAWIYRRVGGIWVQQAKLFAPSTGPAAQGASVDLSADGNTAIVGGPKDDSQIGAAWVFVYTTGGWTVEAKLVATGSIGPAQQGWSVSLSGDGNTALVGGPADDDPSATGFEGTGAAWVFTRSAGVWTQQTKLIGTPNTSGSSRQGASVSLSGNGDVAIIGGPYDVPTGAAWIFQRTAGVWNPLGRFVGSGASADSWQGQSVAMSTDGQTAMVGGMYDQFDGAAWAYKYVGPGNWSQQGPKLTKADGGGPSTWGSQGESVSLSADGNTAVVGAGLVADVSVVGGAWVYTRSGSVWSLLGPKLVGSGAVGNSGQGWDCALSEDANTLIVGGLDDDAGDGAAWVFVRSLPPQNLAIHPSQGGVNEVVTGTISATGILDAATVRLVRTGQPDIVGSDVSVGADGLSLTASFDLHGAVAGAWDVVVSNPYAQSTTLPGGFTVAAVAAPQLRVFAIGPPLIRANRPTAYDLVIENPGNVDALDVPLWITGVPTDATLQLDFALTAPPSDTGEPDWSTVPLTFTSPGGRYAPIVIPRVPPGTTVRRIYLTIPPSDPTFVLRAALTPPWVDGNKFRACLANGGISNPVCMGTNLTAIDAFLAATPGIEALSGIGVWAKIAWQCEGANSLPAALTKAEQVLDFMEAPLEPGGSTISACSDVLPPRWRDSLLVTIVSSYDPDAKLGAQGTLPLQQAIPYSIHFENAVSATAPAQRVVVSDALNTVTLDPNTVSLDAITFGNVRIMPPPGLTSYATTVDLRPAKQLLVQVSGVVDKLTGVVSWNFTSIDPATGSMPVNPLVGFLPPNLAPPEGEGSVLFTVLPRPGLAGGTQITNAASITFDENAPNTTPAWINTVDNTPPASQVLPLPGTSDQPSVPVSWSAAGGTGDLRDYTVYVAEDGGPYRVWRLNTTATADTLVPARNFKPHTYNFYSVARDVSGNIEAAPTAPDATTQTRTAVGDGGVAELALEGARPNPARGILQVWFTLPSRERATLDVVDIAGRRVLRREVGQLGPGSHSVTLAGAPPLRPGLYFLRLVQGLQTLSTRVAVIQ